MPFGIHALYVGVVVAALTPTRRRFSRTSASHGSEQEPRACARASSAIAADGRAGDSADDRAQSGTANCAVGGGLVGIDAPGLGSRVAPTTAIVDLERLK